LTTLTSGFYVNLQSLSSDVAVHHARIVQLLGVARRLQELVTCIGLEARYDEHLEVILTLQDDVNSNLRRLLAFRDTWSAYELMVDKLEFWMKGAERDLDIISAETVPPAGNMRQFWVNIYTRRVVMDSVTLGMANILIYHLKIFTVSAE
jgi:nesprin-1